MFDAAGRASKDEQAKTYAMLSEAAAMMSEAAALMLSEAAALSLDAACFDRIWLMCFMMTFG